MALEFVAGALTGAAVNELLGAIKDARKKLSAFEPTLKRLESTLVAITPRLHEITLLTKKLHHSNNHHQSGGISDLIILARDGKDLVVKCSKISNLNYVKKVQYSKMLHDLDCSLLRYFDTVLQLDQLKDINEILVVLKELHCKLFPRVNNDDDKSREVEDEIRSLSNLGGRGVQDEGSNSLVRGLSPSRSRGLIGSHYQVLAEFKLSPTCALKIQKGDITRWFVDGTSDAIVNPTNEQMLGDGGGADGAIHNAAGPELREACLKVPEIRRGVRCLVGEATITPGFKLPCSHVIHTVGPIYGADRNPQAYLKSAYRNSFRVTKDNNIQYIAFTAISCGVYGYPYDEAATVALTSAKEFANDFKEP